MPIPTKLEYTPIGRASVRAAIMSREVVPCPFLPSFVALLLATCTEVSSASPTLPDTCMEFDIAELEDYLSQMKFENAPPVDAMIGGFKCPVTALPFGALRSDWARLLLLHEAQPDRSILREKLARLFRILAIAYFRMEERFDVLQPAAPIATSPNQSTTTSGQRHAAATVDNQMTTISDREVAFTERTVATSANRRAEVRIGNFSEIGNEVSIHIPADISTDISTSKTVQTQLSPFANSDDIKNATVSNGKAGRRYKQPADSFLNYFTSNEGATSIVPITNHSTTVGFDRTRNRGDHPLSYDLENLENSLEHGIESTGKETKFVTLRPDDAARLRGSENASSGGNFEVESGGQRVRVTPSEIAERKIFNVRPWNRGSIFRSRWGQSTNFTGLSNKLRKLPIRKQMPMENDYWRHAMVSRASTSPIPIPAIESKRMNDKEDSWMGSPKTRKRGSSNTDLEKNFRWFYNFGYGDGKHSSGDPMIGRQVARIECDKVAVHANGG